MRKYLGFVAVSVFLLSCADDTRDNPYDMRAVNYIGKSSAEGSSSSVKTDDYPSSSSIVYSSSSAVPLETVLCEYSGICSPASFEVCVLAGGTPVQSCPGSSSNSLIDLSSSSIAAISSSSVAPSSSSVRPSSSSVPPSSSSIAPSSSSVRPSSSSARPSSSSLGNNGAQWVWSLDQDGGQVPSGGYWFTYGDENEDGSDGKGGCSLTNFPPPGSAEEDIVTDAWKALGGKITYTFNTNCTYKYRFAGIGFNWFDGGYTRLTISDEGDPTGGANAIRLKYSLSADAGVSCVIEIALDGVITGYNNYTSALPRGSNLDETFPFSGFKQATGWGIEATWNKAWQASEGVKFKCEAGDPSNGDKQAALTIDEISFVRH